MARVWCISLLNEVANINSKTRGSSGNGSERVHDKEPERGWVRRRNRQEAPRTRSLFRSTYTVIAVVGSG